MRRNNKNRGFALAGMAARVARAAISVLWARIARRPLDSAAAFAATAGSLVIVINALFLQSRSLPASLPVAALPRPLFNRNPPNPVRVPSPMPAPMHATGATHKPHAATAQRNDPIAKLIDRSAHVIAVQHALSDYGYGQLKPSGILDQPTREAIERFEREHNMPVTGKISERLVNELAVLIGHPLE